MKKRELVQGDIVRLRNGRDYIYLQESYLGRNYLISLEKPCSHLSLNCYDENLYYINKNSKKHKLDIMKVMTCDYFVEDIRDYILNWFKLKNIWTWVRNEQEKVEMTIREIEEELGYPIKIVKEE